MKYFFHILLFVSISYALNGQNQMILEKGTVSFISSQNVYVKFASTENIKAGDTLFTKQENVFLPALEVKNTSSTSSICVSLIDKVIKVGDEFFAKKILIEVEEIEPPSVEDPQELQEEAVSPLDKELEEEVGFKQRTRGRLSVAEYSNLSDYKNTHRMRYSFSYQGNNLKDSRFSIDSYMTFRHTLGEWQQVKDNFSNAFKIYSLAARYDLSSDKSLIFGRKINPKISSMGAIDGFQYEHGLGKLILGAIVGSRPDYTDYSINMQLLQFGAYAVYSSDNPDKFQQSTFGLIEQRNKGNVDRRFMYFQHSSQIVENLNLFSSFEFDLYQYINNEVKHKIQLTNLYLSLRYNLSKKWRLSASYDNRKNIIYYESYKAFIDRYIADETRQGLRFGVNYRPFRYVSLGVNSGLRFQKTKSNMSRNINSYIRFSRVPLLNLSATISANFLQTDYLNSRIFGIRFTKELIKGKLNSELYYRLVNYQYQLNENTVQQNIAGSNLSLRILKKLTWYIYYEGTFDSRNQNYNRFNTKLIQRF